MSCRPSDGAVAVDAAADGVGPKEKGIRFSKKISHTHYLSKIGTVFSWFAADSKFQYTTMVIGQYQKFDCYHRNINVF